MRTILVTGAEGFIGQHVLRRLAESGYEVVAGVRNRARKLAYERQHGRALVCDVADAINVARVVAVVRPDGVVHLAGPARAADAAVDPLLAYQCIVSAWANLLDAVRRTVPRARVVLTSACDVYGNAGHDGRPLREDTPAAPVSTFGSLKCAAEDIAQTFFRDYHLNITIARPFHCLGPGQPTTSYFGAALRALAEAKGGAVVVPDLTCRRDLLHVFDVARAFEVLLRDGRPSEIYNISSGQTHVCGEVVRAVARQLGVNVEVRDLDPSEGSASIPVLCGDSTRLNRELDWKPSRALEDAIQDMVLWYRAAGTAEAAHVR